MSVWKQESTMITGIITRFPSKVKKVNPQEQHKEHGLDLGVTRQSQKDKLSNYTDIFQGCLEIQSL